MLRAVGWSWCAGCVTQNRVCPRCSAARLTTWCTHWTARRRYCVQTRRSPHGKEPAAPLNFAPCSWLLVLLIPPLLASPRPAGTPPPSSLSLLRHTFLTLPRVTSLTALRFLRPPCTSFSPSCVDCSAYFLTPISTTVRCLTASKRSTDFANASCPFQTPTT